MRLSGKTKVAIVGFCETSRGFTPYEDNSFEIWGLNRGYLFMERADRWFEMHGEHIYQSQDRRPGRHVDWLNSFQGPVYMHRPFPEIRTAVTYPLKEIAEYFGPYVWRLGVAGPKLSLLEPTQLRDSVGEPYLSSSIAYEIALAIYEGFDEIHLYGVDLNTESEYAWQKPGVEFLLGWAAGHGIRIVLPDNCPLLKGKLYGRGFMSPTGEHMSYEQIKNRLTALQHEQERIHQELSQLLGARRELAFLMEQMVPGIDHELLDLRRKQMDANIQGLQRNLMGTQGGMKETAYWLSQTMAGQEPGEAIQQLVESELNQGDEGPITNFEQLEHAQFGSRETVATASAPEEEAVIAPSLNGRHDAADIPAGVA